MWRTSERLRLLQVLRGVLLLLAGGLCYAFLAARLGGIPCVFHLLTGLQCPGCGVTRMSLCLLRGDLGGAFRQNAAVLCLLPPGLGLAAFRCSEYVRTGQKRLSRWENALVWGMIAVLLLFGVGRNLLRP